MASKDTPAVDALRKSLETDRRQLAALTERIARQEAELAGLKPSADADTEASANPTKKRKHKEETDVTGTATDDIKMAAAPDDDPIAQVMADPMILGSSILPCLSGVELSRSAEVSTQWKRSITGPELDRLWRALAMKEWPDMVKSLVDSGALAQNTFREFYLRRKRPREKKPPSLPEDDELFILVDMPNLVKANDDGTERILPLQPLHRVFPLASCFRRMNHQMMYEETSCDCDDNNFSRCSHQSGWLELPFKNEVFMPNPNTTHALSKEGEVFRLEISLMRKSDTKLVKDFESSSVNSVVDSPDGCVVPWTLYSESFGETPSFHFAKRIKSMAALTATNLLENAHERYRNQQPDPRNMVFSISDIVFGIGIENPFEDDPSMVPMNSFNKLDMFLNMMRLQWD